MKKLWVILSFLLMPSYAWAEAGCVNVELGAAKKSIGTNDLIQYGCVNVELGAAKKRLRALAIGEAGCVNVELGAAKKIYCLEVADTGQARKTGLQGRRSLRGSGGMLFIFPDDAPQVIWMKNTLMTLDIIFLDDEGVVRSMASRVSPSKIKLISSARYVIELSGGTAEKLDLWPGDKVFLPRGGGS